MTGSPMEVIKLIQQQIADRELRELKNEKNDFLIKLASAMYDKAIAYTNLVIMAGYAGFFGLWSITKDNLTPKHVLWSALFILISISSFVTFETVKMIVNACFMFSTNKLLKRLPDAQTEKDFVNILKEYEKTVKSKNVKFCYFWIFALIIIIPTALIGVSILMYSFIVNLLALYRA